MRQLVGGRYRCEAEIGSGGLGVVYRAQDLQSGETVAVKMLLPQHALDSAVRRRFLREAEVLHALDHPGIVRLLDAGEDGETAFLVLTYVHGESLRRRLDRIQRLGWDRARAMAAVLLDALAHAHGRGVVHRDLKPENVLLGKAGAVVLADFGGARVQALTSVTASTLAWGTPEYMAPELFSSGQADPRADLYSLGVVLYEAATGRLPWAGSSPLARLAEGRPHDVPASGAGEAIDRLFSALLSPSPADRPASAEEVRRRLLDGATQALAAPRCPRCKARRTRDLPLCLSCGREELEARHQKGGPACLWLTSASQDAESMGRLHELLDELTEWPDIRLNFVGDPNAFGPDDWRGDELPMVLFSDLTEADARRLQAEFRARDLSTHVNLDPWPAWDRFAAEVRGLLAALLKGLKTPNVGRALLWLSLLPLMMVMVPFQLPGLLFAELKRSAQLKRPRPGRFRLREEGLPAPRSRKLISNGGEALPRIRSPEVRTLLQDLTAELYLLSRHAEQQGVAASPAARRLLETAPALMERLTAAAQRLDELDAALDRDSEFDTVRALGRLDRRLATTGDAEECEQIICAKTELLATLDKRQAMERGRTRMASALVGLLGRTRDLCRRARSVAGLAADPTLEEETTSYLAAAELDACLPDGPVMAD